jgi:uncharacterized protein YjiS (DUF1127 family)
MAYVTTGAYARKGLLDRLAGLKSDVLTAFRRQRTFNRTVAELNALTDHELADLGIARDAIRDIAHAAAYGK